MAKDNKEHPVVKTVRCKNCFKYKSGIWIDCEGRRFHVDTLRVCDEFKLSGE